MVVVKSRDLSQQVPTTGILLAGANPRRLWMAFVNQGPNFIDLNFIDQDGMTITGRIRLNSGGSAVFSQFDMPWQGSIHATADTATTTISGVEVYTEGQP